MLGDLTDYCNRGFLPSPQRFQMESALHRWLEDMPSDFRLSDTPGVENFASRQLHLPYLMSVMIFARFTSKRVSRTAVLAASYCAGIFETFLARDEIRFLAPVFTIYCISSGFTLLTLFDHPNLWSSAQTDMNIILKSLSQLSKNWRSAIGGLKALQAAIKRKERIGIVATISEESLEHAEGDSYFSHFPTYLCRLRNPYETQLAESLAVLGEDQPAPTFEPRQDMENLTPQPHQTTSFAEQAQSSNFFLGEEAFDSGALNLFGYEHFGSWLLNEPSIAALGGA